MSVHLLVTQTKEMIELQARINNINTPGWKNKSLSWGRAIWVECANTIDAYGYKWWKSAPVENREFKKSLFTLYVYGLSHAIAAYPRMSSKELAYTVVVGRGMRQTRGLAQALTRPGFIRAMVEYIAADAITEDKFSVDSFYALISAAGIPHNELFIHVCFRGVLELFRLEMSKNDPHYSGSWEGKRDSEHLIDVFKGVKKYKPSMCQSVYQELSRRYHGSNPTLLLQ